MSETKFLDRLDFELKRLRKQIKESRAALKNDYPKEEKKEIAERVFQTDD